MFYIDYYVEILTVIKSLKNWWRIVGIVACVACYTLDCDRWDEMRQYATCSACCTKEKGVAWATPFQGPGKPGPNQVNRLSGVGCGPILFMPLEVFRFGLRVWVSCPILWPGLPGLKVLVPALASNDNVHYFGNIDIGKHVELRWLISLTKFVLRQSLVWARRFINSRPGFGCL